MQITLPAALFRRHLAWQQARVYCSLVELLIWHGLSQMEGTDIGSLVDAGLVTSPVKSPAARSPSKIRSPAVNPSKAQRRSWGFGVAARFAATLRQSLEGEPAPPKPALRQAQPVSPKKPTGSKAAGRYSARGSTSTSSDGSPSGKHPALEEKLDRGTAAQSMSEPTSPMFSPLSSGLEQMGGSFSDSDDATTGDAIRASHANDLEMLQKQAGLHADAQMPAPVATDNAAARSSTSYPITHDTARSEQAASTGSAPELPLPVSPAGPGNAQTASHPSAAGGQPGATVHGAGIPPTISLSRVNEVSEGSSSPGGKQLSSAVEVNSATPNGVTSAESIPGRFLARGLSALKIQAGNPGDDAHAGHDKPGSPSPLRDGLAYMTPLSAFGPDTSPQPRGSSPGVTAGGDADQRTPPVAAQTGSSVWPKMQALDEPEDHAASMALINNFRRASERATSPQAASPVALIEPQPNVALEPTPASVSPLAPIPPTAVPHVMPSSLVASATQAPAPGLTSDMPAVSQQAAAAPEEGAQSDMNPSSPKTVVQDNALPLEICRSPPIQMQCPADAMGLPSGNPCSPTSNTSLPHVSADSSSTFSHPEGLPSMHASETEPVAADPAAADRVATSPLELAMAAPEPGALTFLAPESNHASAWDLSKAAGHRNAGAFSSLTAEQVMPTNEPLSAEVPAPEDMKTGDLSGLAPLDGPALAGPAISSPCPGKKLCLPFG